MTFIMMAKNNNNLEIFITPNHYFVRWTETNFWAHFSGVGGCAGWFQELMRKFSNRPPPSLNGVHKCFFLAFDIFAFSQNPKLLAAANTPIKLNIEDWPRGEKTVSRFYCCLRRGGENLSDSPIHNPHAIGRHSEGESLLVSRKRETQKKGGFSIWWQTCKAVLFTTLKPGRQCSANV